MHSCQNDHLRDLLPDWASGRIAVHDRAEVGAHLASCASCRTEVEIIRTVRRALPAAAAVDVERIVAALPAPPLAAARPSDVVGLHERQRRRSWGGAALRVAAAIAAIAVGGTALVVGRRGEPEPRVEQVAATAERREAGTAVGPAAVAVAPGAGERAAAPVGDAADGLILAYLDDAELTTAEYDALLRHLEEADEIFTPVVEPAASPLIGGV